MTTKHRFSPTWSCLISHYCFFFLYLFLKYIAQFNIQYKKIFTSLFPFLYVICVAHANPFLPPTTPKKDSLVNVKITVSCRIAGFSSWVKEWLSGERHLESSAHLRRLSPAQRCRATQQTPQGLLITVTMVVTMVLVTTHVLRTRLLDCSKNQKNRVGLDSSFANWVCSRVIRCWESSGKIERLFIVLVLAFRGTIGIWELAGVMTLQIC